MEMSIGSGIHQKKTSSELEKSFSGGKTEEELHLPSVLNIRPTSFFILNQFSYQSILLKLKK